MILYDNDGAVLYESTFSNLKRTLEEAVAKKTDLQDLKLDPGTDLRDANLKGAKLRYLEAPNVYLEGADLRNASLKCADIQGANLRGANLKGADLRNADVSRVDFTGSNWQEIDLFERAIPVVSDIHVLVFEAVKKGRLNMYVWHGCNSTHCRAGWVTYVTEAKDLEHEFGTNMAAALIYLASGTTVIPDWYTSNKEAMADIERCASLPHDPPVRGPLRFKRT
jgi:uncharacterized protein YjbI with pentapeptide repeats